jgi:flagellar basal body-associated protein FliL
MVMMIVMVIMMVNVMVIMMVMTWFGHKRQAEAEEYRDPGGMQLV